MDDRDNVVEEMWQGKLSAIQKARISARVAKGVSAHSIMLSAYISVFARLPALTKLWYMVLALWHAFCMLLYENQLNHNQLDVLIQFLLKLQKLPFIQIRSSLTRLICKELELVKNPNTKAHQVALAIMNSAEMTCAYKFGALNSDRVSAEGMILHALSFENKIRAEESQPQGLRQLVRIFRKAGELYGFMGDQYNQELYFAKALDLAEGEADCPDQATKIHALLKKT